MTDIAQIVTASRAIEILHPGTGDRLGVRVNVVHIDDERLAKEKRRITDRRIYLEARGKTFKAEEIEENKNILLFTAMTGWDWYNPTGKTGDKGYDENATPTFDGAEQPEFDQKTVFAVLRKLPWFSDQINEAVGETKAFFTPSKQN
jgi:hypothetical protein